MIKFKCRQHKSLPRHVQRREINCTVGSQCTVVDIFRPACSRQLGKKETSGRKWNDKHMQNMWWTLNVPAYVRSTTAGDKGNYVHPGTPLHLWQKIHPITPAAPCIANDELISSSALSRNWFRKWLIWIQITPCSMEPSKKGLDSVCDACGTVIGKSARKTHWIGKIRFKVNIFNNTIRYKIANYWENERVFR